MIKTVLCSLLFCLSISAAHLQHLYNFWGFEQTSYGVNAQPFQIANPSYEAGLFGDGLRCDGTTNSAGIAIGTGTFEIHRDFTGMLWVKPYLLSGYLVDNRTSSGPGSTSRGLTIVMGSDGTIQLSIRAGSTGFTVTTTNSLSTNLWNCVFFGYNSATSNSFLVLNNLKYTSISAFVPSNGSPANIGIGGRISGFLPVMDGVFDNFALWRGTVLSDATMSSLYNSGAGVDYPFQ